jgi:hypothetical protein
MDELSDFSGLSELSGGSMDELSDFSELSELSEWNDLGGLSSLGVIELGDLKQIEIEKNIATMLQQIEEQEELRGPAISPFCNTCQSVPCSINSELIQECRSCKPRNCISHSNRTCSLCKQYPPQHSKPTGNYCKRCEYANRTFKSRDDFAEHKAWYMTNSKTRYMTNSKTRSYLEIAAYAMKNGLFKRRPLNIFYLRDPKLGVELLSTPTQGERKRAKIQEQQQQVSNYNDYTITPIITTTKIIKTITKATTTTKCKQVCLSIPACIDRLICLSQVAVDSIKQLTRY